MQVAKTIGSSYSQSVIRLSKFLALWLLLSAPCSPARAQQPKIPRIGYLKGTQPDSRDDAFREGLRALGYIEGQTIRIEWRFAQGKAEQSARYAAELVRLNVDVIVATGPNDTRAAKEATSTIPIVMAQDWDPVGSGFVASLAHPGGNITGLSSQSSELTGKRLELLKEILPKLTRVAVLVTPTEPGASQAIKELELSAKALKLRLQFIEVGGPKDIESAFTSVSKMHPEALFVQAGAVGVVKRIEIIQFAAKSLLPAIYGRGEYVDGGGLMSYGPNANDLWRRAATYVDKILKGAKPVDLPVEQPVKFDFVVNLKVAKQLGLTIPQWTLQKADRVIR